MTEAATYETLEIDTVDLEEHGVLMVRLNRPEKRNALSTQLRQDLKDALAVAGRDSRVRVITLAANGPSFCGGNDLTEMGWARDEDAMAILEHVQSRPNLFESIWDCPKPVIALVHKHCLGAGIEVLSACDMVVSSDDALYGWPELRGGAFAPTSWPVTMPVNLVKEYLMTGRVFDADEALRVGIVNRVVPRDELEACGRSLAINVASTARGYPTLVKAGVNHLAEAGAGVRQSIVYTRQMNVIALRSEGSAEFWGNAAVRGRAAALDLPPAEEGEYWRYGRS